LHLHPPHADLPPPPLHQGLSLLESDLPEAYDYVAPCFPPGYNAFDALFQMYHVQVAGAEGVCVFSCVCMYVCEKGACMHVLSERVCM
jgi:hypothetical protein